MSFASNLKRAMCESCTNTTELAAAVGVSKSSISQYTSGAKFPRSETLEKIAEVLDCTVEILTSDKPLADGKIINKISVAQAARILGKSEQFVRVSLQQGTAPFGFAVKNKTQYSYHISPYKLKEYIGEVIADG